MQVGSMLNPKVFFFIHFTLAACAMSSNMFSLGYFLVQGTITAVYIWSMVSSEDSEPLFLLTHLTGLSILLDAILIGVGWTNVEGFSAAVAIILLLAKPFMTFFLFNMARQSSGQGTIAGMPSFGQWQPAQANPTGFTQQQQQGIPQTSGDFKQNYGSYQEQP